MYNLILKIYMQVKLRLAYIVQVPGTFYELEPNKRLSNSKMVIKTPKFHLLCTLIVLFIQNITGFTNAILVLSPKDIYNVADLAIFT